MTLQYVYTFWYSVSYEVGLQDIFKYLKRLMVSISILHEDLHEHHFLGMSLVSKLSNKCSVSFVPFNFRNFFTFRDISLPTLIKYRLVWNRKVKMKCLNENPVTFV